MATRWSLASGVANAKGEVGSTKYQVPSTKCQVPSAKCQVPSDELQKHTDDGSARTSFLGRRKDLVAASASEWRRLGWARACCGLDRNADRHDPDAASEL